MSSKVGDNVSPQTARAYSAPAVCVAGVCALVAHGLKMRECKLHTFSLGLQSCTRE